MNVKLIESAIHIIDAEMVFGTCSALHSRQWGADANTEQHGHALVSSTARDTHDTISALPCAVPGSPCVSWMADGMCYPHLLPPSPFRLMAFASADKPSSEARLCTVYLVLEHPYRHDHSQQCATREKLCQVASLQLPCSIAEVSACVCRWCRLNQQAIGAPCSCTRAQQCSTGILSSCLHMRCVPLLQKALQTI